MLSARDGKASIGTDTTVSAEGAGGAASGSSQRVPEAVPGARRHPTLIKAGTNYRQDFREKIRLIAASTRASVGPNQT